MDALPYLVLRTILIHVRANSQNDLAACALVSRTWYHATVPCLYAIVALDLSGLDRFLQSFDASRYGRCVGSLTLQMTGDTRLYREPDGLPEPHPELRKRLQCLVPILPQLTNLVAFSFCVPPRSGCFVPRREIIDVLGALPDSCRSLELETRSLDRRDREQEPQEKTHVCEALRRVLPRMQYVRIRMAAMCSAMFCKGGQHGTLTDLTDPIPLPNLRAMIVNCGSFIARCGARDWFGSRAYQIEDSAWPYVTKALEMVVENRLGRTESLDPDNLTISAVATTEQNPADLALWQAIIRADMVRKESWAIPRRGISVESVAPGSWLVRLPDGSPASPGIRELLGTSETVERLGEGEIDTWFDLVGGARLPRGIINANGSGLDNDRWIGGPLSFLAEMCGGWGGVMADSPGLRTPEQWRRVNPRKMTHHWLSEEATGKRLFSAEKRMGEGEYLSLRPIVEITPEGWERGFHNALRFRVGA